MLQNVRTLILQKAGYWVSPAHNDHEALSFIGSPNTFDLVLLCHSVPEPSRMSLVSRIKELYPKLPVLILYSGYDPTNAKFDGAIHNLDSPESLLNMVQFLIERRTMLASIG